MPSGSLDYAAGIGVNLWIAPDGRVGTGNAPRGTRQLYGGHYEPVTEAEAQALTAAGWGHCLIGRRA